MVLVSRSFSFSLCPKVPIERGSCHPSQEEKSVEVKGTHEGGGGGEGWQRVCGMGWREEHMKALGNVK